MGLLILPLLAALLSFARAETGDAYHGPPQARELFSYDDVLYYFYSDKVQYKEAESICEAGNMHLTNLDTPGKAKFAAESIAEAWMVFEDMWIGAQKKERGQWYWDWTKKRIPEDSEMLDNFTYSYPPWVDNELPARDGKNCLAVDRNGHNDPYFVDLDCSVPRPFICEQNKRQNKTDPWGGGTLEIFDIEFILYHGRLSWSAAVSFCQQQGFSLATVENMSVARKLAKAMLKSRPEFEDAWIGAYMNNENWVWVENGEEVKTIPGVYKNPDKGDFPGNTITPQFPPWFENSPRKGRECVIFDRHLCDEPKFIDLKCNRQRDFICIKREKQEKPVDLTFILDRARNRYIFFPVSATWIEAKKICDEESDVTTMLNLTDIDETKFIMQAMADSRKPIDHLWLGGKIIRNQWMWIQRDEESGTPIPTHIDETGFPPWCDNETNIEMSCLNLDRQNHWTPLIYGLECNSTQAVVCVQPVEPNDKIVDYKGSGDDDMPKSLRVTKLASHPLSWMEAEAECSRDIGTLWRPRFDIDGAKEAIDDLGETLHKLLLTDENLGKEVEVYHVQGGKFEKGEWTFGKKKINITTGWDPEEGDCLVGQINKTEPSAWNWFPVKCYHKLYSQIICEPRCSLGEIPYEKDDSEWICDAASSSIFDHKMLGMGCNHRCKENQVLVGPERYQCTKEHGWISPQADVPVQASECAFVDVALDAFSSTPGAISTLGFVIDSTSDSPDDYNASKYLIGNLIDYYRARQNSVTVYIVSIEPSESGGAGAHLAVKDFRPTEDCQEIRKQLDTLVDKGEGIRDYAAGLASIKDALKETSLGEANIVFVVPEANQRGNFKEVAKEINGDAKVYAIGTNKHTPINQLVDVASRTGEKSFAMQFKKPPDVIKSVKALVKTSCPNCKCGEAFEDLVEAILAKQQIYEENKQGAPRGDEGGNQAPNAPEPNAPAPNAPAAEDQAQNAPEQNAPSTEDQPSKPEK